MIVFPGFEAMIVYTDIKYIFIISSELNPLIVRLKPWPTMKASLSTADHGRTSLITPYD
jgi:hypothetical protein